MKKYRIEANKRCFSDVPGAVFVSWDTCSTYIKIYPAIFGLDKRTGCVSYYCYVAFGDYTLLDKELCDQIYYDHPKREEAWLVLPDGTGYEWIPIDDLIEFS